MLNCLLSLNLIIRGRFSDNISDVEEKGGKLIFSKPLDEHENSGLSANLINQFVRRSFEVLDKYPLNIARAKKGLFSANVLLCRGAGSGKVKLKKLRGKWMGLGYMPLEIGIERAVGMEAYKFRYPKLKGIDVYANLYSGLKKAIRNAIKMLKRNRKKYDYFYIHFKECDIPGHDNKPLEKVKMIELMDKRFFGYLRRFIKDEKLIVTADHVTSCRKKAHTAGIVPVLFYQIKELPTYGIKIRRIEIIEGQRFTESDGMKGEMILGRKLLEEKMFSKKL